MGHKIFLVASEDDWIFLAQKKNQDFPTSKEENHNFFSKKKKPKFS